jgi:hypothetical protein
MYYHVRHRAWLVIRCRLNCGVGINGFSGRTDRPVSGAGLTVPPRRPAAAARPRQSATPHRVRLDGSGGRRSGGCVGRPAPRQPPARIIAFRTLKLTTAEQFASHRPSRRPPQWRPHPARRRPRRRRGPAPTGPLGAAPRAPSPRRCRSCCCWPPLVRAGGKGPRGAGAPGGSSRQARGPARARPLVPPRPQGRAGLRAPARSRLPAPSRLRPQTASWRAAATAAPFPTCQGPQRHRGGPAAAPGRRCRPAGRQPRGRGPPPLAAPPTQAS